MVLGASLTLELCLLNRYPLFPTGPFQLLLVHPTITQDDIDDGITFQIDYKGYLDRAPLGECDATYFTVLNNGVTGRGVKSNTRVAMGTTHVFCDGTEVEVPTTP